MLTGFFLFHADQFLFLLSTHVFLLGKSGLLLLLTHGTLLFSLALHFLLLLELFLCQQARLLLIHHWRTLRTVASFLGLLLTRGIGRRIIRFRAFITHGLTGLFLFNAALFLR